MPSAVLMTIPEHLEMGRTKMLKQLNKTTVLRAQKKVVD